MGGLVVAVFYGSILFCIIASCIKLYGYARYPVHLRWEVYNKGSAYEYSDWWQKKGVSQGNKVGGIIQNAATLKGYLKNNTLFWLPLFPFHLGVYLLILWHVWLFAYPFVFQQDWPVAYSLVWGHTATGLMFAGAFGVLALRLFSRPLRVSYPGRNYLKWIIIMAAAGTGYAAVEYYFNGVMADVLSYVKLELQFDMAAKLNPPLLTSLHVLTVSAVLVYLPFSHALRLFFRYYHELRWNYVSIFKHRGINRNINNTLDYPITWAAKHIPAGVTWRDIG